MIKRTIKTAIDLVKSTVGEHTRPPSEPKLWVYMYHRILPESDPRFACEEPGMLVTPETLAMHIEESKQLFEIVSLNDWVEKFQSGDPLPEKACAFTFDDGWLDNYEFAAPILKEHNVPGTLFTVTDKMGTDFRFWPNIISLLVSNKSQALKQHPMFKEAAEFANQPFSKERIADCINTLKAHTETEIFKALNDIKWRDALSNTKTDLMSWSQVLDSGFEIGCHTSTHKRLTPSVPDNELVYELETSKQTLKQHCPNSTDLFCYPNGDYSPKALQMVQSTYSAAVTTQHGINRLSELSLHQLKRIPLHEDRSNTRIKFRARLAG